ncbi:MAG: quinate 5-dehydrogenase [Anaerolineae bacterium]|nr:quinate 5-dehydrogenase [Anaerolineae bacterium]
MKKVLSVSMGSSKRDHTTEADFLGRHFWLSRQGTDGDFERYIQMYREYDGKVDAFGVGGAEFYILVNNRRYYFRDVKRVRQAVRLSKIADGNGIKHLLAPYAVQALRACGVDLRGKRAFVTSAVDRYGMARALVDAGCETVFGDLMFYLGLPIPIRRLRTVHTLAALLAPPITQLPYMWFYPLGEEQDREPVKKYSRFYEQADVIAGDFLQVWSNLPDELGGKIIVTNTTTARNVEELQRRNLHMLVTTTPRLAGRSFGTNVMEAVCRCLVDKPDDRITDADLADLVERIPLKPQVHVLN